MITEKINGIITTLFDGFTDNTCEYFTHCSYFVRQFAGLSNFIRLF